MLPPNKPLIELYQNVNLMNSKNFSSCSFPLIELYQNVNYFPLYFDLSSQIPLIELYQNVNTATSEAPISRINPFNRTILECKFCYNLCFLNFVLPLIELYQNVNLDKLQDMLISAVGL